MLTPWRVLLVEDTPISAEVAGEILRSAGYPFDVATDGLLAIEAVRQTAYRVVLMDCQLPHVDGFEATRRIRALEAAHGFDGAPRSRRLPIVALTSCTTAGDRERARLAGMDDFLSKPVDARRLLSALAKHGAR
jgi:CheY-like chemotaxis protein